MCINFTWDTIFVYFIKAPDMAVIPTGGSSRTFYAPGEAIKSSSMFQKKTKKRIYYDDAEEDEDDDQDGGYEKIITKTKVKIISKGKKKNKVRKGGYYEVDDDEGDYEQMQREAGVYSMYESNSLDIRHRIPKPAVCMTWSGNKVKTFDGLTYTANLYCSHVLIQDATEGAFSLILRACPYGSHGENGECPTQGLVIFLQSVRYTFEMAGTFNRLNHIQLQNVICISLQTDWFDCFWMEIGHFPFLFRNLEFGSR